MTENNISDAAVDAAVGAHCEGTMRAALEAALPFLLEAAAPHMLAEAKAAALEEAAVDPGLRLSGHSGISITQLRALAARIRAALTATEASK